MIGMGRMGSAMARRLLRAGHGVVAYDVAAQAARAIAADGAVVAGTLSDLDAGKRPRPITEALAEDPALSWESAT